MKKEKAVPKRMVITKSMFETYEIIRFSGSTNMLDTKKVSKASHMFGDGGMDALAVLDIITNYNKYKTRWPEVIRR